MGKNINGAVRKKIKKCSLFSRQASLLTSISMHSPKENTAGILWKAPGTRETSRIDSMAMKKNLTDDKSIKIYYTLLEMSENGQLKHGSVKYFAEHFYIYRHTVMRL